MNKRPLLRQAADLTAADFEAHPVWVHCHIVDYDEPWYEDTDEETFRPWLGRIPVAPGHAIYLLRAGVVFADGSCWPGIVTPAEKPDDFGSMQPCVFIGTRCFTFWGGMPGVPKETREEFYREAKRGSVRDVFPAQVRAEPSLASGVTSITVHGFYRMLREDEVECER